MLVLSRHRDEKIVVGGIIDVTVVDIRGDKVRLGVEAPACLSVHRQEILQAIRRNGESVNRESVLMIPVTDDFVRDLACHGSSAAILFVLTKHSLI